MYDCRRIGAPVALRTAFLIPVALSTLCHGADLSFLEEFALGKNRGDSLRQLIEGTEDAYYYRALDAQSGGRLDEVDQLLPPWIEKHGRTERVVEIENRQILLRYATDPQKSLAALRERLGLRFDHQRMSAEAAASLPSRLDPALWSREALTRKALEAHPGTTDGFESSALEWLATLPLTPELRRDLLGKLNEPDVPGLAQLVVDDLNAPGSKGFGSRAIHERLLLDQLDECAALKPDLLQEAAFILEYVARLQPGPDVDIQRDAKAREDCLERLWAFASRLGPAQNSLKAHVLYQWIELDFERGAFDADRFLAYVRLPRKAPYSNAEYLRREAARGSELINLNEAFQPARWLPPVANDEALVRAGLERVFREAKNPAAFAPYFDDKYFRRVQAETGLLYGMGEPGRWLATLTPAEAQALKERVDIDFAPTNPRYFAPDAPVTLDVYLKNARTLIVKVFEVNTANYYREVGREVDASIDVDGLVPGQELQVEQKDPPFRRVLRRLELPSLGKRGVYVVELIGNGKASRAVLHKGQLTCTVRESVAGQIVTVLDEDARVVPEATVWLGGREYTPDADGGITLPYTQKPGTGILVLQHGDFASRASFIHRDEKYDLRAGIHVERESLIAGRKARLAVRPVLFVHDTPVTLSVIEEPTLTLTTTDRDGISASQEIKPFPLFEDRESEHEFFVPARLAKIEVKLAARVPSLTQGKPVQLASTAVITVNGIDATEQVDQIHLLEAAGESTLELLGRSGEPKPGRAVQVELKHRDFQEPFTAMLQTDAQGRVGLGRLDGIVTVAAQPAGGAQRLWMLPRSDAFVPDEVHGTAGGEILVASPGLEKLERSAVSLLEPAGSGFVKDRYEALSLVDGALRLRGLPAGNYQLRFKSRARRVNVIVGQKLAADHRAASPTRVLELPAAPPLTIASAGVEGDTMKIRLAGALEFARVHVIALRYVPDSAAFDSLSSAAPMPLAEIDARAVPSLFVAGRDIGEEYRYVLERKLARKFPGNMIERPGLLLQPWNVAATETAVRDATAGGRNAFEPQEISRAGGAMESADERGAAGTGLQSFQGVANLDFLAEPAALLLNLKPDANGVVNVPRSELGAHSLVQVVAVSPVATVARVISLPDVAASPRDLRLISTLDPRKHYAERREVSFLQADENLVFEDASAAQFEVYDTIGKALRLLATVSGNATLAEFGFIADWPRLSREEKLAKYSKYSCHELDFFLFKKDPGFFREVVRPYLAQKLERTFLDDWLLERDVLPYVDPWAFARLNAAERILLAQRVEGERPRVEQHVRDLLELIPEDVERRERLFEAALRGRALETAAGLGGDKLGERLAAVEAKPAAMAAKGRRAPPEEARAAAAPAPEPTSESAAEAPALAAGEDRKETKKNDAFFRKDAALRRSVRQLYRSVEKTQEQAETNYYHIPLAGADASLVPVGDFWLDYARSDPKKPFFSPLLAEASHTFAEMMLALAVTDLPFERAPHELKTDGKRLTIQARGPLVVYHKQTRALDAPGESGSILLTESFFRQDDRYAQVDGQKVEKPVTGEFVAHVVYGCQVVATNPTSSPQRLNVLLQIPDGAIPVLGSAATRSVRVVLTPFHVWTGEYFFYFPKPGEFAHYPVHAWSGEKLVGSAQPRALNVVATPSQVDTASWDHVSQNGTEDQVIEFLRHRSLAGVDLDRMAWRLKSKAFFERAVQMLRERHVYAPLTWSYALLHNVPAAAREFLRTQDNFVISCGSALTSPLLTIDPFERRIYEHLEYWPFVNARAHQLGRERAILNDKLRIQYSRFLDKVCHRPSPTQEDLLEAAYYLLLQDRVEEASEIVARGGPDGEVARLQRDYMTAYLGFTRNDLASSRGVAEKNAAHPVERWRRLFREVLSQLDEIEGKTAPPKDADSPANQQALAATEPSLDVEIEGSEAVVRHRNLTECRVSYYLMDVELLFSRTPFLGESSGQFSLVRPNAVEVVKLDPSKDAARVPIPERFLARNVLVEVSAAGLRKAKTRFAGTLDAQIAEAFAQARVTNAASSRPSSGVYVKVYARRGDGSVKFYKDGYTDLRGRFDYGTLSTSDLDDVQRFALLFVSDDGAAVLREAAPPKR